MESKLEAVKMGEEKLRNAYGDPIPCSRMLPPECRVVWGWLVEPDRRYWDKFILIDKVWHTLSGSGESACPVKSGVVTHWHPNAWPPTPDVG